MKPVVNELVLINVSAIFLSIFASDTSLAQQIIPDTTLPENSVVTEEGNIIKIDGGTRSGNNLFHSFEQFTVSPDNTAFFNNAIDVQNIFSRVTGSASSNIDGVIQANGTANLFLLNPNGILFGENASLNIGGSFLATTADRISFEDGTHFSATIPLEQPLLTITAPIGLGFGNTSQNITNKSRALDKTGNFFAGLQVEPGKTIGLVGNQVFLDGGFVTVESGRIELGSVGNDDFVSIVSNSNGWRLNYQKSQSFQDITLSEALINVIGSAGGDVHIQGKNVLLNEGSRIFAISQTQGQAGNLEIKASESLKLEGASENLGITSIFNEVEGEATGNGSNLLVETERLIIKDGAQLSTGTFGSGKGVDLIIKASKYIKLEGNSGILGDQNQPSGLFARVGSSEATGNAGAIKINTEQLIIKDGAQISNDTRGIGNGGTLEINASDSILIEGTNLDGRGVSGIFSQVEAGAIGNGGNLTLNTNTLSILKGAQISTSARSGGEGGNLRINAMDSIFVSGTSSLGDGFSSSGILVSAEPGATGDAGKLTINTAELTVEKGAKISADNFGTGEGANVDLNVDRLIISNGGIISAGTLLQPVGSTEEDISDNIRGLGGTLTINATESVAITGTGKIGDTPVNSSLFTRAEGTGDAGNLTINTPNLTVADGGDINVSATGTGDAGELLEINANNIQLNDGSITAATQSSQGGNITLNIAENLELRNNSEITATAGIAQREGDGGNVIINSDFILAFPTPESHEITAEAFEGDGGKIDITTNNILGRESIEISASSNFGIDGTVAIETPDVDPTSGVVELADVPVDAEAILAQDLCRLEEGKIAKGSSFIITGRGGLTPTAEDSLGNIDNVVGWANRDDLDLSNDGTVGVRQRSETEKEDNYPVIQQSQGWVKAADGSVWLVANTSQAVPQKNKFSHPECNSK